MPGHELSTDTAAIGDNVQFHAKPILHKNIAVAALVAQADFLFYGHPLGISVLIFTFTLAAITIVANPIRANWQTIAIATIVLILALAPVFEDISILSLGFAAFGVATFALMMTSNLYGTIQRKLSHAAALLVSGPFEIFTLFDGIMAPAESKSSATTHSSALVSWIMPLILTAVFLGLFIAANPIVEQLISQLNPATLIANIEARRLLFWSIVAVLTWSFVAMRSKLSPPHTPGVNWAPKSASAMFGTAAIVKSLILLNTLFAFQTALDLSYLWSGMALPNGMTYAAYAHRGAYPLMITTLLAGGLVFATTQPGSTAIQSRWIKTLIYIWMAQNVVLVASAILRLDLYVAAYSSLTEWRIAAFIWMGLTALALIWLVIKIAQNRSNSWLISTNLITVIIVLYACCFVNFPHIIAAYNLKERLVVTESRTKFDLTYLSSLGPEVIPAMETCANQQNPKCRWLPSETFLSDAKAAHQRLMTNWRAWTYRHWRLQQHFNQPRTASNSVPIKQRD
jgi:hypothetical protein